MTISKEQLSKMYWVTGVSRIDYSDLEDKEKIEKAIDESINDLANRLREFVTVQLFEDNNKLDVFNRDVIVRTEVRIFDTRDLKKEITFNGHLGIEKINL